MDSTINLLIVDDHQLVRQGLRLILGNQPDLKFNVFEVDDGEKALPKYQSERIDVILMDITMSKMNGIDATKSIINFDSRAKVIALSMNNETYLIKQMLHAGAMGYLLKDTETSELKRAIKTVLGGENYFTNEVSLKLLGQLKEKRRSEFNESQPTHSKISKREIEVLNLIARQFTNEEIGLHMGLSKRTVDAHRQRMLLKLGLKNTAGLILYGIKNHLINNEEIN